MMRVSSLLLFTAVMGASANCALFSRRGGSFFESGTSLETLSFVDARPSEDIMHPVGLFSKEDPYARASRKADHQIAQAEANLKRAQTKAQSKVGRASAELEKVKSQTAEMLKDAKLDAERAAKKAANKVKSGAQYGKAKVERGAENVKDEASSLTNKVKKMLQ